MFSLPTGRRGGNGSDRPGNYAMIPLDRNRGEVLGNDDTGNARNAPSPAMVDFEGDLVENEPENNEPPRRPITQTPNEHEQLRRQQVLRLGLIACLVLFMLDGSSYSNVTPDSRTANVTKHATSYDDVRLSSRDLTDAKTVLLPLRPKSFAQQNATGMFKGAWQTYNSYTATHNNYDEFQSFFPFGDANSSTFSVDDGSLIMTLKSVPIHDLPDLSFTYGLARTYNKKLKLVNEMSFPMQGVLFAAERKLLMFSTPYKSQKLMMQFTSTPNSASPSASPTASPSAATEATPDTPDTPDAPATPPVALLSGVNGQGHLQTQDGGPVTRSYDLVKTESEGIAFRIRRTNEEPGSVAQLKFFVWDTAIAKFNTTHWHNNETRTIPLGESQLSVRFHYFQSTRPPMTLPAPSAVVGLHGSTFLRASSVPMAPQSSADEAAVSPSTNHIQTPASLGSDCFYALDLDLADSELNVARVIPSTTAAMPHHSDGETVTLPTGEEASWTRRLTSFIPAAMNVSVIAVLLLTTAFEMRMVYIDVMQVHGAVKGFFTCSKTFMLSVSSYQIEYDALKSKIEIYSLLYTAVSLTQVVFVIYQIRHSSTQAISSRMSISSILAQSVLDAVICMGHLMLGAGISDLFFTSFVWISILKLLLFSVFQMRLVIHAYQARFAQELSVEGLRGLRARLVTMHVRFYGIVMLILILGFSVPIHPMIIVVALYSFWWPQIVHNAVHGTKHSLHPAYLYGMTASRLFLPLYLMGCPANFLAGLWEYLSPSGQLAPGSMLLSPAACYFLVVWMAAQVLMLHMQTVFGPRFFVPKRFLPQRYDYRRPLPASVRANLGLAVPTATSSAAPESTLDDSDLETGALLRDATSTGAASTGFEMTAFGRTANPLQTALPPTAGGNSASSDNASEGLECVICYNAVDVQGHTCAYMITPCDHVFHEDCLKQWLRVKLECPVCRTRCPPADDETDQE